MGSPLSAHESNPIECAHQTTTATGVGGRERVLVLSRLSSFCADMARTVYIYTPTSLNRNNNKRLTRFQSKCARGGSLTPKRTERESHPKINPARNQMKMRSRLVTTSKVTALAARDAGVGLKGDARPRDVTLSCLRARGR